MCKSLVVLIFAFLIPFGVSAQVSQKRTLAKAQAIDADLPSLERVNADVRVFSAGDLATGYFAGSSLELIVMLTFTEEGEESSNYYFDNNELFLVSTTIQSYNENIFSFDEPAKSKEVKLNEDGEHETDWDWGVGSDSSATSQDDHSWETSQDMFADSKTTHYYLRKGKILLVTDKDGKEVETSLDFYTKKEESLNTSALIAREALIRKR